LAADMRGNMSGQGPDEVWNHAIFRYQAKYMEHVPAKDEKEDEKVMVIWCELTCNMDDAIRQNFPPAVVASKELDPTKDRGSYINQWRIRLDDKGKIVPLDPGNFWYSVHNDGGGELYTPIKLDTVGKPSQTPQRPGKKDRKLDFGNEFVGTELI